MDSVVHVQLRPSADHHRRRTAAYRGFVLDLAKSVATAAPGGEEAESGTIAKIEAALAASEVE
jgi:hypothetical protein